MHIHHSLRRDGEPAFFDAPSIDHRSADMRHWIGGLIATMPGAVSILAPTVNSYRRMVGFAAAPTTPTWCEENKSTALRGISRSASNSNHRTSHGELRRERPTSRSR